MDLLTEIILYIASGTGVTLSVIAIALPLAFCIGLVLAILRVYGGRLLENIITLYSIVMRGIPPIVLLFVLYFILAKDINLSPFVAGTFALSLISSSYQMEIFRGAFLSVASDQMIAARSIGMNQWHAIRFIILPQALRAAIPPWSNEAAMLVKESSLVYVIGIPACCGALSMSAPGPIALYWHSDRCSGLFFLTFLVNRGLDFIERKFRIPTNITT